LIDKEEPEVAGRVKNTSATSLISSEELCKEVSQENQKPHDSCLDDVSTQIDHTDQQVDSNILDRKGMEATVASNLVVIIDRPGTLELKSLFHGTL